MGGVLGHPIMVKYEQFFSRSSWELLGSFLSSDSGFDFLGLKHWSSTSADKMRNDLVTITHFRFIGESVLLDS